MGRTGFWNKKRISEAKHYPTGVRRYCDKHGVTFESYQNYCWRHQISAKSAVTDRNGNATFTFELFQQALQSPVPTVFCKEHNLSYATFYNYKKNGFPSSAVEEADLKPAELTDEDVAFILDSTEANSGIAPDVDVESVDQSDSARNDVVISEVTKHRVPKGFWTLDRIEEAKNYPNGFENFFKDNNVSVSGYKTACRRFGLSSALPTRKRTRTNCGRKDHFWSLERIKEAKSYPGGIKQFCADNGTTEHAYQMACYVRGVDFHVDPNETRTKNPHGFWSLERIDEAKSYPGGIKAFCDKYHISVSTYKSVCSRFGVSSSSNVLTVDKSAKAFEPAVDTVPTSEHSEVAENRMTIRCKNGSTKEIVSANDLLLFISSSEIENITFSGAGSISFI